MDVRTKFFTTQDDEIFLEAQITNTTPHALHMQKVVLAPSPLYTAADLNFLVSSAGDVPGMCRGCAGGVPGMCGYVAGM